MTEILLASATLNAILAMFLLKMIRRAHKAEKAHREAQTAVALGDVVDRYRAGGL